MGQNVVIRKEACPECRSKGYDEKGDNLVRYSDNSAYCFACQYSERGEGRYNGEKRVTHEQSQQVNQKPNITFEQNEALKERTTSQVEFRGIRSETNKYFGVLYLLDEDGNPVKQYVPCTINGELSGYKPRELPKKFGNPIGNVGSDCDMIGQFRFKNGNGVCLIVGGEVDQLSAYQMLRDYQIARGKGEYSPVAVVSPSVGESGSAKQIQKQYEFFNRFDKIIIGFDNDEAGKKATETVVKVLPKGKVFIAEWTQKDPNEYLVKDKSKEFINDFYRAKKYVPAGVVGSSALYEKLLQKVNVDKIPLPPFMWRLDEMIGSIELGTIGLFAAGTGAAKTTVANELIYHWLFNSPYKIGVVTLELDSGAYAQAMLSRHLGNKISLIKDPSEKLRYLKQPEVIQKANELFTDENGLDRWMLIDERDGDLSSIQNKIEELVISCDCKVIILDPVSDLLDGVTIEQQAVFMKWMKAMIKNYNMTFLLIAHIRKGSSNKESASTGAFVPEEAVIGSSTLIKSSSFVVMMSRDKYNENPVVRNTTHLVLSKNRSTGVTGSAGSLYYDNVTHTLHDLDDWLEQNPMGVEF